MLCCRTGAETVAAAAAVMHCLRPQIEKRLEDYVESQIKMENEKK
jgi:hypothetical protein